jgi:hypothetical protein
MKEFDELVKKHHYRIKIYWFYEENDEDNLEEGEDILEFYVKESHFRLIEVDKLQDYL